MGIPRPGSASAARGPPKKHTIASQHSTPWSARQIRVIWSRPDLDANSVQFGRPICCAITVFLRGKVSREWQLVEPLIPPGKPGGGKRTVTMREGVNGLMYVLSTRAHSLPTPTYRPPQTI